MHFLFNLMEIFEKCLSSRGLDVITLRGCPSGQANLWRISPFFEIFTYFEYLYNNYPRDICFVEHQIPIRFHIWMQKD